MELSWAGRFAMRLPTAPYPPPRIDHALFTLSGNAAPHAIEVDLQAAGVDRGQTVFHLRIEDHQDFIRVTYEGALAIGIG